MSVDNYLDSLKFQDRTEELIRLCSLKDDRAPQNDWSMVWNVFGEAGIGKTRLLCEIQKYFETEDRSCLVMYINLESGEGDIKKTIDLILHEMIDCLPERIDATWQNPEQVAGVIVNELVRLTGAPQGKILILFDTTEKLQTEMKFWNWLEINIVGPLVLAGGIRQVFAGRTAVPWRRIEVRRKLQPCRLEPLPDDREVIRELAKNLLDARSLKWAEDKQEILLVNLIAAHGSGHPRLSIALAEQIINDWNAKTVEDFMIEQKAYVIELYRKVVKTFIDQNFLEKVPKDWNAFIWWLSPLEDPFDLIFVREYLDKVLHAEVKDYQEYSYIQFLFELRIRYSVLRKDPLGEYFNGVIGDVTRRCFRILNSGDYTRACQQIAITYENMAKNYLADDADRKMEVEKLARKYEGYSKGEQS